MRVHKGDLIQLNSWFGDVYAEVTDSGMRYFHHVMYSKDGDSRWEVSESKDSIRKIIHKKDISAHIESLKCGVLYLVSEHYGSQGHHVWSHPIVTGRYRSNYPEER